jgi:hypothetical protein
MVVEKRSAGRDSTTFYMLDWKLEKISKTISPTV